MNIEQLGWLTLGTWVGNIVDIAFSSAFASLFSLGTASRRTSLSSRALGTSASELTALSAMKLMKRLSTGSAVVSGCSSSWPPAVQVECWLEHVQTYTPSSHQEGHSAHQLGHCTGSHAVLLATLMHQHEA